MGISPARSEMQTQLAPLHKATASIQLMLAQ
jgi:hypothetical protein